MKLCDAHCHLQDEKLLPSIEAVLVRAQRAGVEQMLCCGTQPGDWEAVAELCQHYPHIIPCFGLHPWYLDQRKESWLQELQQLLTWLPSGVGEIGLDHGIANRDDALQEAVFSAQLELAQQMNRPVNLHCRRAWERMIWFLEKYPLQRTGAIIHSFSGAAELVPQLADLGVYFSFSGSITRANHTRAHRALQSVPMDRLLLETDAPDIPPVMDHQVQSNQPNEPANLRVVLEKAAALKQMSPESLADAVWQNAQRLLAPILQQGRS